MDSPIVYIEKEPFLNMIIASIETFKRECLGLICGSVPTRSRNYFLIDYVITVQLAKKRKNSEVDQSRGSKERMSAIFNQYPTLFNPIGDFHSHTEWGDIERFAKLTDTDIADMVKSSMSLCVLINIVTRGKEKMIWEPIHSGGIRGSLGKYKYQVNAIRLDKNEEQEYLSIKADSAVKSLNHALGYK